MHSGVHCAIMAFRTMCFPWSGLVQQAANAFQKHRWMFFFFLTFLLQELGLGLLYWAVSRQRQRKDCSIGRSPGNEMTVLLVSPQARGRGGRQIQTMLFKRGLGFGWGWRAHVACGRGIRYMLVGSHLRCYGTRCPRTTNLPQGR